MGSNLTRDNNYQSYQKQRFNQYQWNGMTAPKLLFKPQTTFYEGEHLDAEHVIICNKTTLNMIQK